MSFKTKSSIKIKVSLKKKVLMDQSTTIMGINNSVRTLSRLQIPHRMPKHKICVVMIIKLIIKVLLNKSKLLMGNKSILFALLESIRTTFCNF